LTKFPDEKTALGNRQKLEAGLQKNFHGAIRREEDKKKLTR
jgi:hypothetical protein